MTKYMNKQNGKVMEILKQDTEKGTMIIQFTDGKTTSITTGTFKRWYKPFEVTKTVETLDVEPDVEKALTEDEALEQAVVDPEEAYVREVMEQKKELGIECPEITSYEEVAGDGTPLAQVGKEIAEQAKQKAKAVKKERQPKESQAWVEEAKKYVFGCIPACDEIFVPNKILMRTFKVGGHMYGRLNYSKSSISLSVKSSSIKEGTKAPDKKLNHMFDAQYNFKQKLTEEDKKLIESLLDAARAQRVAKNESSNK